LWRLVRPARAKLQELRLMRRELLQSEAGSLDVPEA